VLTFALVLLGFIKDDGPVWRLSVSRVMDIFIGSGIAIAVGILIWAKNNTTKIMEDSLSLLKTLQSVLSLTLDVDGRELLPLVDILRGEKADKQYETWRKGARHAHKLMELFEGLKCELLKTKGFDAEFSVSCSFV